VNDITDDFLRRVREGDRSETAWQTLIRSAQVLGIAASSLDAIRNNALRAWCRVEHPEVTEAQTRARLVRAALLKYNDGAWKREGHRDLNSTPRSIAGTSTAYLWTAMKYGALSKGRVLSIVQLSRILKS
jgi:hypothetical protein